MPSPMCLGLWMISLLFFSWMKFSSKLKAMAPLLRLLPIFETAPTGAKTAFLRKDLDPWAKPPAAFTNEPSCIPWYGLTKKSETPVPTPFTNLAGFPMRLLEPSTARALYFIESLWYASNYLMTSFPSPKTFVIFTPLTRNSMSSKVLKYRNLLASCSSLAPTSPMTSSSSSCECSPSLSPSS